MFQDRGCTLCPPSMGNSPIRSINYYFNDKFIAKINSLRYDFSVDRKGNGNDVFSFASLEEVEI